MDFKVSVSEMGRPVPIETIRDKRVGGRLRLSSRGQTRFEGAHWLNVNLSGSRPWSFIARGSEFVDCDFSKVKFDAGFLCLDEQTLYQRCSFAGADLRRVFAGSARFEECEFRGARMDDWGPESAEFIGCHFEGRLADVRFSGRPVPPESERMMPRRTHNDFRDNDFRACELVGVGFTRGIDLDRQLLPTGVEYLILDRPADRIERARRVVSRWSDDARRQGALTILRIFSDPELFADQAKLSIHPADFDGIGGDPELWTLLTEDVGNGTHTAG